MSSAMRSNNTLPAIWKAGKVMPSSRKIHWPDRANRMSTPAVTRQARRAMRSRDATESRDVMAINAGIVAIGSTITNSELSAKKQYATRFMSVSHYAEPPPLRLRPASALVSALPISESSQSDRQSRIANSALKNSMQPDSCPFHIMPNRRRSGFAMLPPSFHFRLRTASPRQVGAAAPKAFGAGAGGEARTHTTFYGPGIFSPGCPPFCHADLLKVLCELKLSGEVPRSVANTSQSARSDSHSPAFWRRRPDQANPAAQ